MQDLSYNAQKASFAEARLIIARDMVDLGLAAKVHELSGIELSVSGEIGSRLPIVARAPYARSDSPEYDADPILIHGYEYSAGYERLGQNSRSRGLWPVVAYLEEAEPIPLQPNIFSDEQVRAVSDCIDKLTRLRREQFPFACKNLFEFFV